MSTSDGPISIRSVTLIVRQLDVVAEFYRSALGLNEIHKTANDCVLGQGELPLLTLIEDKQATPFPREAGLFHTAFLLPSRADLGAWLKHTKSSQIKLDGAADHFVSEAVYLSDPEGNGIEVYVDRPRSTWQMRNNRIVMGTERLDFQSLEAKATAEWHHLPEGSVIGHVHLQVGNVDTSNAFYQDTVGFDLMAASEQAGFYGSGGYHHQLAGNTWNSLGAGRRPESATGLVELEFNVDLPKRVQNELTDPWGLKLKFRTSSETIQKPALSS